MLELAIGVGVCLLILIGLFFLLSYQPDRAERRFNPAAYPIHRGRPALPPSGAPGWQGYGAGPPQSSPPAPIGFSLETAERMVEREYARSPSRRTNGGDRPHPSTRETPGEARE